MPNASAGTRRATAARRPAAVLTILVTALSGVGLSASPAGAVQPVVAAASAAPTPSPRPVIPAAGPPAVSFPSSPGAELVIDNRDTGFTSTLAGGAWPTSAALAGFHGSDYAYGLAGTGGTARWTPDVATAGWYGVYAWMPDGVGYGRATAARFTVNSADATTGTHLVDQAVAARGDWLFLGNHRFDAGTGGFIELAAGSNGTVVADAIRLGPTRQETIPAQLDRAAAAGSTEVRIAPGVYRQAATLDLRAYPGITILADGAWLVLTNPGGQALYIPSDDVTVDGLGITYETMPYTQGRVIQTSSSGGGSMVVQISDGFRRPAAPTGRVITWDSDLRLQRGFADGSTFTWIDQPAGVLQVSGSTYPALFASASIGDIATIADVTSHTQAISVDGTDVTLRDVVLRGAPAMGLMNAVGGGNLHLDGFQLIPPAKPAGATEEPIMSSVHDGLQFQSVTKGPTIEDSLFVNAGDDTFSNPGVGDIRITGVAGDVITATLADASGSYRTVKVGDRLQQWLGDGVAPVIEQAVFTGSSGGRGVWEFTVDAVPGAWGAGTTVTSSDRMGADWVFRNNQVDSSGRGLLVKAPNGEITGNWIRGANAISVASEIWSDSHANAGGHLLISGNEIYSAPNSGGGVWNGCQRGAVSFESDESLGRSGFLSPEIQLVDNTFVDIRGLNLLVANAADVTVTGNRFLGSHRVPAPRDNRCDIVTTSVITVMQADGVHFADNEIDWMGPYSVAAVHVEAGTTTGITGLPDGVTTLHAYAASAPARQYGLTNAHSGLRLALSTADALVQQDPGQPAQSWRFEPSSVPGAVRIVHHDTGRVLTAGTGTSVTPAADTGAATQLWRVLDLRDGLVRIVNDGTGTVLGTDGAVTTDGAPIGRFAAAGMPHQAWELTDVTGVNSLPSAAGAALVELPPASVVAGSWELDGAVRVFPERLGHTLATALTVGGTTIPSGTRVNVHYVHADRVGSDNVRAQFPATLGFDGDVLAVAGTAADLVATTSILGRAGTAYSSHPDQGLEFDDVVAASGSTLDLLFTVYCGSDAVRVISRAP